METVTDTLFGKPGEPDNADIRATVTQWLDDWNAPAPTGFQRVTEGAKYFFSEYREAVQKRKAETVAHARDLTGGKESGGGVAEPNTRCEDPPAGLDPLTPEQPGRVHACRTRRAP